jgi:hypothetical protein
MRYLAAGGRRGARQSRGACRTAGGRQSARYIQAAKRIQGACPELLPHVMLGKINMIDESIERTFAGAAGLGRRGPPHDPLPRRHHAGLQQNRIPHPREGRSFPPSAAICGICVSSFGTANVRRLSQTIRGPRVFQQPRSNRVLVFDVVRGYDKIVLKCVCVMRSTSAAPATMGRRSPRPSARSAGQNKRNA